MRRHVLRERRLILQHCIGLLGRKMISNKQPGGNADEAKEGMKQLAQLIVLDAQRGGYTISSETLIVLKPLMRWRQRYYYRDWSMNPLTYLRIGIAKLRQRLA